MNVDKYYSISDIINEALAEDKVLADRWLEYVKKNYKKKTDLYLSMFIVDFVRDFGLIDDFKDYFKISLEMCLDNEELIETIRKKKRVK